MYRNIQLANFRASLPPIEEQREDCSESSDAEHCEKVDRLCGGRGTEQSVELLAKNAAPHSSPPPSPARSTCVEFDDGAPNSHEVEAGVSDEIMEMLHRGCSGNDSAKVPDSVDCLTKFGIGFMWTATFTLLRQYLCLKFLSR